ncbi:MAG: LON peptidase substrate-binding domain-containing protein, partial [Eubacteriales bacterium]|nr:LON peptidase substrate-binding domain-containing protein [Eubacteriales bacterium]
MKRLLQIPMIPLRGTSIFPHMVLSFEVGRERSIAAVDAAVEQDSEVFLVTQRDVNCEEPAQDDLYAVGVLAHIKQVLRTQDGVLRIIAQGGRRAQLDSIIAIDPYWEATVQPVVPASIDDKVRAEAMARSTMEQFENYATVSGRISPEVLVSVSAISEYDELADTISAQVVRKISQRQQLLETLDPLERLERLQDVLASETD